MGRKRGACWEGLSHCGNKPLMLGRVVFSPTARFRSLTSRQAVQLGLNLADARQLCLEFANQLRDLPRQFRNLVGVVDSGRALRSCWPGWSRFPAWADFPARATANGTILRFVWTLLGGHWTGQY